MTSAKFLLTIVLVLGVAATLALSEERDGRGGKSGGLGKGQDNGHGKGHEGGSSGKNRPIQLTSAQCAPFRTSCLRTCAFSGGFGSCLVKLSGRPQREGRCSCQFFRTTTQPVTTTSTLAPVPTSTTTSTTTSSTTTSSTTSTSTTSTATTSA